MQVTRVVLTGSYQHIEVHMESPFVDADSTFRAFDMVLPLSDAERFPVGSRFVVGLDKTDLTTLR